MEYKILNPNSLDNCVCVLVGTRPGIIKFSPIIRELDKQSINFYIFHTGQHYSFEMDQTFFNELSLPKPKFHLKNTYKFKLHGEQTAHMMVGVEKALVKTKPKIILVGGDANTNLAGALAARKLGVDIAHIESGLRSNDWRMPEEHNRVMIDHISDILFCPTEDCKNNLLKENIRGKIYVFGNSISDAVDQNSQIAERKSKIIEQLNLDNKKYFVVTLHREENVDSPLQLHKFINILEYLRELPFDIIFPIHPRTLNRFKINNMHIPNNVKVINPLGYFDFLKLIKHSKLVITDSGGIQEEACILKIPCITLRDNTERPETIEVGANVLTGLSLNNMKEKIDVMINKELNWKNPYGYNVSQKIVEVINKKLNL